VKESYIEDSLQVSISSWAKPVFLEKGEAPASASAKRVIFKWLLTN
jgi:hypothetical protein